jgi:tetratricopeptide (TPR) repeat protein
MDWRRTLTAAHGYLELGMGQDAWDELDAMPPEDRARVEVVLTRLMILQSMERWDKAAEIAIGAVRFYPDSPDLYLMGAYAIRRKLDVGAALEFLVSGKECMEDVATYWFNVGCYHCQIGELTEAKRCVKKAVSLDRGF